MNETIYSNKFPTSLHTPYLAYSYHGNDVINHDSLI